MKIVMIVERTRTGYSAYSEKYPLFTTGKTLAELKRNMLEAVNLYFGKEDSSFSEQHLQVKLDLPQFFSFYRVINAKALSERIGMNQSLLAQYIKGHKKPSAAQTRRILKGVQEIGNELRAIQFIL